MSRPASRRAHIVSRVDLSAVIFVVLAVAWAVYLIPKALKHHDEVARTRPVETFSSSMRVLARREAVSKNDTRLTVTQTRTRTEQPAVSVPAGAAASVEVSAPPAPPTAARRSAAKAAARRRRRILGFLLLCDVLVGVATGLGYLQVWAPAIPVALTVAYLVLCRTQVRHEGRPVVRRAPVVEEQPATEVVEHVEVEVRVDEQRVGHFDQASEDTMSVAVADLQSALAPTADGGTLWDPLPVTLPTYVGKPTAKRTVRTIDLGEPGTWTSGRTAEDALIAAEASAAATPTDRSEGPTQHAVGG
jgi:hypothetical protein